MGAYSVTDLRSDLRLAALRDAMGRKYVVHLSAEQPGIGAELAGGALGRGTRVMLVDHTGQAFDVTVDASECSEQYVFERLHVAVDHVVLGASAAPGSRPARPAGTQEDTQGDVQAGLVPARR